MIKLYCLALSIVMLPSVASACRWGPTTLQRLNNTSATMVTSENNQFLLKMLPSRWGQKGENYFKLKESIGTVFKLGQYGDFQFQWNTKDINTFEVKADLANSEYFEVLLSNDGKRVTKVKQFGSRFKSNKEMLMSKDFLVIYDQGKVSIRYSYFDIFKKLPFPKTVSCPGLVWVSDIKLEGNLLSFVSGHTKSKDAKKWSVDITTGKSTK